VRALDAWLDAACITEGPVFRGVRGTRVLDRRLCAHQVARIVQKRAAAVGLDPTLFAGHSLRSGYISSAADHGASLQSIAVHAAHKKLDTTRGYVQVADAFRDHSGKRFL
jgi:site-specific recombinase XerD